MVRHWIVDHEIVCSNPTHGRNLFMSCARSAGLLSPFGKMCTSFQWPVSSAWTWNLKYGSKCVYVLCWFAVFSDCTGLRVENNTRRAGHKTVHTRAYHMPSSHTKPSLITWTKNTSCISRLLEVRNRCPIAVIGRCYQKGGFSAIRNSSVWDSAYE